MGKNIFISKPCLASLWFFFNSIFYTTQLDAIQFEGFPFILLKLFLLR